VCPYCGQGVPGSPFPSSSPGQGEATVSFRPEVSSPPIPAPWRLGRFEIRRELGEGAFGKVYEARDPQLDRAVALKVAKLNQGDSAQRVKRFLREAKAAASLRHPHIVPVFEFGQDGDQFYIASAFIPGQTLQATLQKRSSQPPDLRWAAQMVRQLAEALAYAHGQGIVHRDVKPANMMVDERGEPLLMDFGLAARQEDAEQLTHLGAVVGTPRYMAPEQARGKEGAALPASDQYSLGIMLFEMLTGKPPFQGAAELVMFDHLETPPPSPRQLNPRLSRDLETICLKCLEKNIERRFASCQALADDLRRWLEGDPIQARRIGPLQRFALWCRRNPLVAFLSGGIAVSLLLGFAVAWWLALKAQHSETQAQKNEKLAQDREKQALANQARAEWRLYTSYLSQGKSALEANHLPLARHYLDLCRWDLRGWEHHHLVSQYYAGKNLVLSVPEPATCLAISPQGQIVILGDAQGNLKWINTSTGLVRYFPARNGSAPEAILFSPDGSRFFTLNQGVIKTWAADTGAEVAGPSPFQGHPAAFSSDGQYFLAGQKDHTIRVQPVRGPGPALTFKGHSDPLLALASNGQFLASASKSLVKIVTLPAGQNVPDFPGQTEGAERLAFSPNGQFLVMSRGEEVKILRTGTWEELTNLQGHTRPVTCLAISPDSQRIATASQDSTIKIWDPIFGEEVLSLQGHTGPVVSLAFAPGGKFLFSGGQDRTVRVWNASHVPGNVTLRGHRDAVLAAAFSQTGTRLASAGKDRTIRVWDLHTGRENLLCQSSIGPVDWVAFSSSEQYLLARSQNTWMAWDVGKERVGKGVLHFYKGFQGAMTLRPDGKTLLGQERKISLVIPGQEKPPGPTFMRTLDLLAKEEKPFPNLAGMEPANLLAASPDGLNVAAVHGERIKIWEINTGRLVSQMEEVLPHIDALGFSPDGQRLLAGNDQGLHLWQVSTGQKLLAFPGRRNPQALAISPDGQLIASAQANLVKCYDASQGQEVLSLAGHEDLVHALVFSPEGNKLVSASQDRTLKIWSLDKIRQIIPGTTYQEGQAAPDSFQDFLATLVPREIFRREERLTTKDNRDPKEKCYFRPYTVPLEKDRLYTISLESADFDAFLRLQDEQGKELASSDDGEGNDARIVFQPSQPGSYRIIATTAEKNETGSFRLRITEEGHNPNPKIQGPPG
jgi:WD40 repeat protein